VILEKTSYTLHEFDIFHPAYDILEQINIQMVYIIMGEAADKNIKGPPRKYVVITEGGS